MHSKRKFLFALALALIFLTSCTSADDKSRDETGKSQNHPNFSEMPNVVHEDKDGVVDLRNLNGNIIYAEIYNMMMYPDEYLGKTIKVKGQYYGEENPDDKKYYHFVFISDAQACCQQGLEFICDGALKVPDDYPNLEQGIEISGVWSKYKDGENTFYRLKSATVEVLGD